jgi:hypothetical protein
VWSWTLGALVAGVYSPDVWGQTASVSGRALAPGQVGKARGLLIERLGDDLRALDVAAGRSGQEVGAWSTRVGMELRCAEAFAQEDLRITLGEGPARRLILGPALLRLLTAANAEAADTDAGLRTRTRRARIRTSPPPRSPTGSPDTSRPWPPTRTARSARR